TPTQIPTPRAAGATIAFNGRLLIAGGEVGSSSQALTVVEVYDPAMNSWTTKPARSEEHTSELQSRENLVCRLLLEKKNQGVRRGLGADVHVPALVRHRAGDLHQHRALPAHDRAPVHVRGGESGDEGGSGCGSCVVD